MSINAAGTTGQSPLSTLQRGGSPITRDQALNLHRVIEQGDKLHVSDDVKLAAVATVLTETNGRNYGGGDHDSLGLFQQRGGASSVSDRLNPDKAASTFYKRAIAFERSHPGASASQIAHGTQRSATEAPYARNMDAAKAAIDLFSDARNVSKMPSRHNLDG